MSVTLLNQFRRSLWLPLSEMLSQWVKSKHKPWLLWQHKRFLLPLCIAVAVHVHHSKPIDDNRCFHQRLHLTDTYSFVQDYLLKVLKPCIHTYRLKIRRSGQNFRTLVHHLARLRYHTMIIYQAHREKSIRDLLPLPINYSISDQQDSMAFYHPVSPHMSQQKIKLK